MPLHSASPSPQTIEIRNQLARIYSETVPATARRFARTRTLPPGVDVSDLENMAYVFLLEQLAGKIDRIIRKSLWNEMQDSIDPARIKGRAAKEARYLRITSSGADLELPDKTQSAESSFIERQQAEYLPFLRIAVAELPARDSKVIEGNFGERRGKGRPPKVEPVLSRLRGRMEALAAAA